MAAIPLETVAAAEARAAATEAAANAYTDAELAALATLPDDSGATNGDVLTRTAPSTFSWEPPTGGAGGLILPVPAAGQYMMGPHPGSGQAATVNLGGSVAQADGRVHYVPIWIGQDMDIDRIGAEVTTANTGVSAVLRVGLYATDANGQPTTVVCQGVTAAGGLGTTGAKEFTVAASLTAGFYLGAVVGQSLDLGGGLPAVRAKQHFGHVQHGPFSTTQPTGNTDAVVPYTEAVAGALGDSPTVSWVAVSFNRPIIWLRAA